MAVRVSGDTFDEEVLNAGGAVIADFYSDSCVPCKRLSPVLAEIEEEQGDKVKLVKININFDPELAEKYGGDCEKVYLAGLWGRRGNIPSYRSG